MRNAKSVVLPEGRVQQLFNTGPVPLHNVRIFAATPLATQLPDGEEISPAVADLSSSQQTPFEPHREIPMNVVRRASNSDLEDVP